jgi:D-alanyl-D-alanine carboxypeptidase
MTLAKLVLTALLTLPCTAVADPKAAASHTEQAFDTWLSAHNSGERKQLEAFNAKYKVANDVQIDLDFRESMGSFRLVEVKSTTPNFIEALVVSEWGNALLARLRFDPKDSFDLTDMEFEGVPTPDAFKLRPLPLGELAADTKRRLDALAEDQKLSGSFLIAKDGKPVFEWAGGLADREAATPVTPQTRFRMASLGKMITAVAILQLAEDGRLSLDDPLSRHLPDYPNQDAARNVTLRQLLNHTSGMGEVFVKDFSKISGSLKTHRDYWAEFAATPLEFEPGTKDRYSNYGYILLGSVVEAVSSQSYYDYVEQRVYRPAGMTSTGAQPESEPVPDRAHAYTKVNGEWSRETALLPWRGTAAGGGYTTARDLMRFATALTDGTLLSSTSLDSATRPQNQKAWYGYGFMTSGGGDERQFGHEGGAPGMNAVLNVRPAMGYVIVGLSNFDPATMGTMVNFVTRRLP